MRSYILRENVLSDNTLLMPDDGKVFKGGYIAILIEWEYQSAWTDKETVKKFRSTVQLEKYLSKKYPEFEFYD